MSNSQIEKRYGVPLPIDVLWSLVEAELGPERTSELRAAYRQATRRYGRASALNQRRRLVAHWERQGRTGAKVERYRAQLADPQVYIDGE